MAVYKVKYTERSKTPISINETEIDASTAVKLFGRRRLSYGRDLNENLLRLLESFSCPRSTASSTPTPDLSKASDNMFISPVEGQLWFDPTPTQETLFVYDGSRWLEFREFADIAANWGVIAHGAQIPLPVSSSGRTYSYSECSFIVSPYAYPNAIDYMNCRVDSSGLVTMQYSLENDPALVGGYANYMVVAIPGNVNLGAAAPGASVTPTPTLTPTPTPTRENTPTPTTSLSSTPTPTPSKPASPTPTPTLSTGASPTPSSAAVSPTPTPTAGGPFSIEVVQGDGSQYGDGLVLTANGYECEGFCGQGLGFAPSTSLAIDKLGVKITGGVGPLSVWIDSWSVDPSSPNTMFGEFIEPTGNFSGGRVEGNPLSNPSWTWTGGSMNSNSGLLTNLIIIDGIGKCSYSDRTVTGSAIVHCTDDLGRTVSQPFGWSLARSASGISPTDNSCDAVVLTPPPTPSET